MYVLVEPSEIGKACLVEFESSIKSVWPILNELNACNWICSLMGVKYYRIQIVYITFVLPWPDVFR